MRHMFTTLPAARVAGPTAIVLLSSLLAACGDSGDNGAMACDGGDNLARDVSFSTLSAPRMQREWLASQHSRDISFTHGAKDGVLTITHTGDEPWFVLGQSFKGKEWAGKQVRFSAELKLALTPPEPMHGFRQGGGLMLRARKGGRVLLSSEFEHQPHIGEHDWQRVSVTHTIPAQADSFRIGFQHQASGYLQARNPELHLIPAGCP